MIRRVIRLAIPILVLLAMISGIGLLIVFRLGAPEKRVSSIEKMHDVGGIPVEVLQPVRRDFVDHLVCDGNVVADVRAALRAKVDEVVEAVHARVGDQVAEGQLMVEFRRTDLEEALQAARVAYQEAKTNYGRYAALLEQEVIPQDLFDQATTALEKAAAALRAAESQVEFTHVYSPIQGVVQHRSVEPGEYVSAGNELMVIVDLNTVEVRELVPEEEVGRLAQGLEGEVRLESSDEWLPGVVSRIGPSTEDPNRFFDVYLKVSNPQIDGAWVMRPGMYAEVRFAWGTAADALAVPDSCIRLEGNVQVIYAVEEDTAWVPVDDPEDDRNAEQEDTFGARMGRGWARLKGSLRAKALKLEDVAEGDDSSYQEMQVFRARRLRVSTGLHDGGFVQLLDTDLTERDAVIVNPRDAIREGVLVRPSAVEAKDD